MVEKLVAGLDRISAGQLTVHLPDGRSRVFDAGRGPHAEMAVHRWRFFGRLLRGSDIGAGESYVDGDWSTPDLVGLSRFFLANETALAPPKWLGLIGHTKNRLLHMMRSNTRTQARRNIHAHYDLSNDFYGLFLDPSMTSASRKLNVRNTGASPNGPVCERVTMYSKSAVVGVVLRSTLRVSSTAASPASRCQRNKRDSPDNECWRRVWINESTFACSLPPIAT